MKALIAFQNLVDHAVLTASSARPLLAASMLQNEHVAIVWRSIDVPAWVSSDLGSSLPVNVVALIGCNATATTQFRVRLSDDPTFATSTYDSGPLIGLPYFDPAFGKFVHVLPADMTGRYQRIDIEDVTLAYFQAGRFVVAQGVRPEVNFSFGAGDGYEDLSKRTQSRGGQIYIDLNATYRVMDVTLEALRDHEKRGWVITLDRVNGTRVDVLMVANDESDNFGMDTIFGLIETSTRITAGSFDRNVKSYSMKDRL